MENYLCPMQLIEGKYKLTGGLDPLELCNKYGTPIYVYDTAIIKRQYERLKNAFQWKKLGIKFACKALSNVHILKYFKSLGAGLDCVSIQEVHLGLLAGFSPKEIIYTPNCVSMSELRMAVSAGVRINVDNISILEQFGIEFPGHAVCVRFNPHIMAGGNMKISTGHIDSKFGISVHQLPHVLRVVEATGLHVEGVHMHTGSDILDAEVFLNGAEILFEMARHFPELEYMDFGSGFKVSYKADDYTTDIEELGEMLTKRFEEFCNSIGKTLTLMFEPGKFLVSESGYFFAKANVIKQTTSTVFIGLDTGLNHLIRPMFYEAYHEIVNVTNPVDRNRLYTVVGYICETDTFGANRKISEVIEGDVLCFKNAGAYCFTMASNYNSRFRPAEILVHEGKDYLIRERENMEDLLRNQMPDLDLFGKLKSMDLEKIEEPSAHFDFMANVRK
jgi:diaminopimelate decarboxylase